MINIKKYTTKRSRDYIKDWFFLIIWGVFLNFRNDENKNNIKYPRKKLNGYLVCESCKGYYQLKDGESPEDFEKCECGGSLDYYKTLKDFKIELDRKNIQRQEYAEIEKMVNILKTKTKERKMMINTLSKQGTVEDELLKDIKKDKWTLGDLLEEKRLQTDAESQKIFLDEIMRQEEKFNRILKEQRARAKNPVVDINSILETRGLEIYVIVFVIVVSIILFMLAGK
jgi:hypothetical protein